MTYCFTSQFLYTVDPKLPKEILSEIYKQCRELNFSKSEINDREAPDADDVRQASHHWLPWDTWIAGIMHNIFISANNDYFHYDLNHFDSGIQVTKYGVNDRYSWHTDMLPADNPRKLSMSLLLNNDFEGGELEIDVPVDKPESLTVDLKAGTCAIFPAWVKHRVKPVKSGTRYSLVAWMNGPQFK